MLRRRTEIGFLQRPMIEPDDRIEPRFAAGGNADLSSFGIAHHKRTGGVETDRADSGSTDAGLAHSPTHGSANGRPYILGIMFGMVLARPVHDDRMFSLGKQAAMRIEDTGACAARADIHRNHMITHQC